MTEQEALQDLVTGEGWALWVSHVTADLESRLQAIMNTARNTETAELGQAVKIHQASAALMRQWMEWPARRIRDIENREGRGLPTVIDKRGGV